MGGGGETFGGCRKFVGGFDRTQWGRGKVGVRRAMRRSFFPRALLSSAWTVWGAGFSCGVKYEAQFHSGERAGMPRILRMTQKHCTFFRKKLERGSEECL